jgi:DNA replication and repair protein RecF
VRLLSLSLRNYRNYDRLDLEPGTGLSIFLGANGQGKTNLLEAIAMLALSSSPRARRESELIGPVGPGCRIEGLIQGERLQSEIVIEVSNEGDRSRRSIRVDGVSKRAVDLPGHFRAVLFWPDDLELVKAGPENRRRLLNHLLVQVEPGYARSLGRYRRVLEQRNSLLKSIAAGDQPSSALEVWDLELASLGSVMARARAAVIAEMQPLARRSHAEMAGSEELEIEYVGPPENLLEAVQKSLVSDLQRGTTTVGPHRDDLIVSLGGRDARSYASQGQQRTAVVSLKLAESSVICARTGEPAVLLLDDVLSELDSERRRALLAHVSGVGQVIVTSAEGGPFPVEVMERAFVRCIDRGRVGSCG